MIFFTISVRAQTELTDSINHQGLIRKYIVHLPPGYNGTDKFPLIMVLHGGGSGDATTARDKLHFEEVGDTANFITIFPYGYYNDWADGRGVTSGDTAGIDDVSFLTTLLDTLKNQYSIDSCKTHLTGLSNGGMMTLRIACESPTSFTAYAGIISSLPDSVALVCNPEIPVSILLMPGTDDPIIPYEGGHLNFAGGSVIGVDSTISFWLNNNGCPNAIPDSILLPDIDLTDNSTVKLYEYGFCDDSSEVVLYKVIGGGHTIPGMEAIVNPIPFFGYINYDIDAAIEIWSFFKRHSKSSCSVNSIYETFNSDNYIILYPNPTNGQLEIETNENFTELEISVFTILGERVIRTINQTQIDVNSLATGTYFVKVEMDGKIEISKIIKIE